MWCCYSCQFKGKNITRYESWNNHDCKIDASSLTLVLNFCWSRKSMTHRYQSERKKEHGSKLWRVVSVTKWNIAFFILPLTVLRAQIKKARYLRILKFLDRFASAVFFFCTNKLCGLFLAWSASFAASSRLETNGTKKKSSEPQNGREKQNDPGMFCE